MHVALAMEVLLEFKESRQELLVSPTCDLCELIKDRIFLEKQDVLLPFDEKKRSSPCYLLQRFSPKWSKFVDIKSTVDIKDGDQLLVIKCESKVSFCKFLCDDASRPGVHFCFI